MSTKPVRAVQAALICAGLALAHCVHAAVDAAANLHAKHQALRAELQNSSFRRPIHIESGEQRDSVAGTIYAVLDHPFAQVGAALTDGGNWCEILLLPVNTKYCAASTNGGTGKLDVRIAARREQSVEQAHAVEFAWRVAAREPDYIQVTLDADRGPMTTRDYRVVLEAVPAQGRKTFMRLSYSYGFGLAGRLAMQAYLATSGRNKVGFTIAGTGSDGRPQYIGGMRGVVERNTMRYYLAIEAFLGTAALPEQARMEQRLRNWYAASERYPLQLHEIEQGEYLDLKRADYRRPRAG